MHQPITMVAFILILAAEKGHQEWARLHPRWLACLVVMVAAVVLVTGASRQRQTLPRRLRSAPC